jgi:hypothetical protein
MIYYEIKSNYNTVKAMKNIAICQVFEQIELLNLIF